eukprot:evm.model.NODE_27166_length_9024_cov_18.112478.2
MVMIFGEISTAATVNYEQGLDYNTMNVIVAIEEQSPDIAQSVDSRTGNVEDIGAGDQGIMFG